MMSKHLIISSIGLFLSLYFIITCSWVLSHANDGAFDLKGSPFQGKFLSESIDLDIWQPAIPDIAAFPLARYQPGTIEKKFEALESDIRVLNAKYPAEDNAGHEILFHALGDSLLPHVSSLLKHYQADSLLLLLEWAERFKGYVEATDSNAVAYSAIYHFWIQQIATALDKFGNEEPDRKVVFKFRYLAERCGRNDFYINIKETRIEKFKKNLLAGNWAHLIGASWHDASVPLKAVFVLFPLLTGIAYLQLLYSLFQKLSKRKE